MQHASPKLILEYPFCYDRKLLLNEKNISIILWHRGEIFENIHVDQLEIAIHSRSPTQSVAKVY